MLSRNVLSLTKPKGMNRNHSAIILQKKKKKKKKKKKSINYVTFYFILSSLPELVSRGVLVV